MRLVYVGDSEDLHLEPHILARWEVYRFHDERATRERWRAPVSPYFHVVDAAGYVLAKGVANKPDHLDRLLSLRPTAERPSSRWPVESSSGYTGVEGSG
jgi:hypothetical protein